MRYGIHSTTWGCWMQWIHLLAAFACGAATGPVESPPRAITGLDSRNYPAGAAGSFAPVTSPDGQLVAFVSLANNLATNDDLQPFLDVFARGQGGLSTALVSVDRTGHGGGNGDSIDPVVSADHRFVAFQSDASNLVADDTNGCTDVFVRDLVSNLTALVSVPSAGAGSAPGCSTAPLISADGRWVVFESTAIDLVPGTPPMTNALFARDLQSGTTRLVSADLPAGPWRQATDAAMTPDARRVVFLCESNGMTSWAIAPSEIFVRDLDRAVTDWASANVTNDLAPPVRCLNPAISANGRFVAFKAFSLAEPGGTVSLFRHDLQTRNTVRLSTRTLGNTWPAISGDGRWVAFDELISSTHTIVLRWDADSGSNVVVSVGPGGEGTGFAHTPIMTTDGNAVAFLMALEGGDVAVRPAFQVCLRDLGLGTSYVASVSASAPRADHSDSLPALSEDGRRVVFESRAPLWGDLNQAPDIYGFAPGMAHADLISSRHGDRQSTTAMGQSYLSAACVASNGAVVFSTLADSPGSGQNGGLDVYLYSAPLEGARWVSDSSVLPSASQSSDAVISGDGQTVAFVNVLNAGQRSEVYVACSQPGYPASTPTLASASWTVTNRANGRSSRPSLNGNGRWLVFQSDATDLVPGLADANQGSDIFVRDLGSGTNALVSMNFAGTGAGNQTSSCPAISLSGRWVLFRSGATDLASNAVSGAAHELFLRDLATRKTRLVSMAADGSGRGQEIVAAQFAAAERHLLFANASRELWVHELATGALELVTTNGAEGSISSEGRWVAFRCDDPAGAAPSQVWVKDRATGVTLLASVNRAGLPGNADSFCPVISGDGRFVVFASRAGDLADDSTRGVTALWVRDWVAGTTLRVTRNPQTGAPAQGLSTRPVLGADGRTIVFRSWAPDLVADDFNQGSDFFVLRLAARDSDGDALDDDWELARFETLARDGRGDFDQDGQSDAAEFRAGTDPTHRNSVLRVLTLSLPGTANTTVLWAAVPGQTYRVQYKSSADDSPWTDLSGWVTPGTTLGMKRDTGAEADEHRYYRVVIVP